MALIFTANEVGIYNGVHEAEVISQHSNGKVEITYCLPNHMKVRAIVPLKNIQKRCTDAMSDSESVEEVCHYSACNL